MRSTTIASALAVSALAVSALLLLPAIASAQSRRGPASKDGPVRRLVVQDPEIRVLLREKFAQKKAAWRALTPEEKRAKIAAIVELGPEGRMQQRKAKLDADPRLRAAIEEKLTRHAELKEKIEARKALTPAQRAEERAKFLEAHPKMQERVQAWKSLSTDEKVEKILELKGRALVDPRNGLDRKNGFGPRNGIGPKKDLGAKPRIRRF